VSQAEQTATKDSPSMVWFKSKGYWIVIAGVVLLISLALVLFFTSRSRHRRGTLEAIPEKEMTSVREEPPSAQYEKPTSKWVPMKDDAGKTYYYNQETGASQWEVPDS
jgi:cytochrome c-type biogenesis protein CcmH/NrfG